MHATYMIKFSYTLLLTFMVLTHCQAARYSGNTETPDTTHLAFQRHINTLMVAIKNSRQAGRTLDLAQQVDHLMDSVLAKPESMHYAFDSLTYIGNVTSDDGQFRIFTWNVPLENGTFKYYGKILYKPDGKNFRYINLNDKSETIEKPEQQRLTASQWYGALYYEVISHTSNNRMYYTVLGLNLNDMLSNKKIIDVIWFDEQGQVHFGASIFRNKAGRQNRIIFEYSARVVMGLKYDERMQMIIYDHLAPFKPQLEGRREFYGPDFSYDGFKLERGVWNFYPDLDVRRFEISGNNQ
jgi:hypothetical protein